MADDRGPKALLLCDRAAPRPTIDRDVGLVHRLDPITGRHLGTARTGDGARAAANPGAGPAVLTTDGADVVAGLRAAGR